MGVTYIKQGSKKFEDELNWVCTENKNCTLIGDGQQRQGWSWYLDWGRESAIVFRVKEKSEMNLIGEVRMYLKKEENLYLF